ncbi:MAG TPA: type II toxin-antitoxin system HicB family antitoxin [Thermomicrobiaceae bacterium]|nr:type II toxin-antitoxin system HicB family antitoxin [Thermomicrobiaceae bacterium]
MNKVDAKVYAYVRAAVDRMQCEWLTESQEYFCTVPGLQGAWATGKTEEEACIELRDVLEEWVQLGLKLHQYIPVVAGIDLNRRSDHANGIHVEPQS